MRYLGAKLSIQSLVDVIKRLAETSAYDTKDVVSEYLLDYKIFELGLPRRRVDFSKPWDANLTVWYGKLTVSMVHDKIPKTYDFPRKKHNDLFFGEISGDC